MITLYNYYQNGETGREAWQRTVLSGERAPGKPAVYWQESKGVNVLQSGLSDADSVLVMLWFAADAEGRTFVPPKAFAALSPAEVTAHWTLTPGRDRIVRGIVSEEIALKDVIGRHDDCITVSSVDTWADCSPSMRHWEVRGK